jgi:multidrug efflux pump subunit AcrB
MNPTIFALRRPITMMVAVVSVVLLFALSLTRIGADIFPQLNLPVIYVAHPYGGMDPVQMEGMVTNYYEYHFLYINGIHHVESKSVQGLAFIKLVFHPGTDMSQAMAETINYAERARAFMPPGTLQPFVMRFDVGTVPVGKLVLSSQTRGVGEVADLALFRVRPVFASLPGVSAPPPFGSSARTVVITANPIQLQALGLSPDQVIQAIAKGNAITPSGNLPIGSEFPIVSVNSMVEQVKELGDIPIKPGIYLRDIAVFSDSIDVPAGYALVNGRRSVFIEVTKRADASTLSVIHDVKKALPRIQSLLPEDVDISFEFDQSIFVSRAINSLLTESILGAILVALTVLLFLRDWRSVLVIVLNIPLSLMAAVVTLWITGQTINLMTLGGLALAVGLLVDEATVEIENIHRNMSEGKTAVRAVKDAVMQTRVPRLLAMLCIFAVFLSSFFMQGAARALFVPLSLAVGFTMVASYILSSTFVPVLCVWLLRKAPHHDEGHVPFWQRHYNQLVQGVIPFRLPLLAGYLAASLAIILLASITLGREIFPKVDMGQLRVKIKAPPGSHVETTEEATKRVLGLIEDIVGKDQVEISMAYVGNIPSSYPINAIYLWTGGPHEATLWVLLKDSAPLPTDEVEERLRAAVAQHLPGIQVSFEPADIINQVMSFGSPTPVEISVNGPDLADSRSYADKLKKEMAEIPSLRDLQFAQLLDYPRERINVDKQKASFSGVDPIDVGKALLAPTSSTRYVYPMFWTEPKTGIGYKMQLELPRLVIRPTANMHNLQSMEDLKNVPVASRKGKELLVGDVADIEKDTIPGQIDRYNMRRQVSLTANIVGRDLDHVSGLIKEAMDRAGELPRGVKVETVGQVRTMRDILNGLRTGVLLAVVVIFLLLAANFQSFRLALAAISTVPAIIAGVVLMLLVTGTTLNIQSFIGMIMAIGVGMANAILLVNFAERYRQAGANALEAALHGARTRLRAILMTTMAMVAGMAPMALGVGEFGQQNAPLGRAVIGGLLAATAATLFLLPCAFAVVQAGASIAPASLDPDAPNLENGDLAGGTA